MDRDSQDRFNENIKSRINSFKNAQEMLQSIVNTCSSNGAWYEDKINFS